MEIKIKKIKQYKIEEKLTKSRVTNSTKGMVVGCEKELKQRKNREDYRLGLHRGFNYALQMVNEELGDEFFIENKFKKMLVSYYSDLVNIGVKERHSEMLKNADKQLNISKDDLVPKRVLVFNSETPTFKIVLDSPSELGTTSFDNNWTIVEGPVYVGGGYEYVAIYKGSQFQAGDYFGNSSRKEYPTR